MRKRTKHEHTGSHTPMDTKSFFNVLGLQTELSSSWKRVDIVSADKFFYQRDAIEPRARSFTERHSTSPSQADSHLIHKTLSPSAEVFRPRSNTAPLEQLSRSLPTTVPESPSHLQHPKRQGSRTPKRKDAKVAPRFYPAFSKENVSDQVIAVFY